MYYLTAFDKIMALADGTARFLHVGIYAKGRLVWN